MLRQDSLGPTTDSQTNRHAYAVKTYKSATGVLLYGAFVAALLPPRIASAANPQIAKQPCDPAKLSTILVSPNSKPTISSHGEEYKLPSNYDSEAQERVDAARRELLGLGTDAFIHLIEHLDDKRYSMTACGVIEKRYFDLSVRDVCRDLLFCQIEPIGRWTVGKERDPRSRPTRPSYAYSHHLDEKDTAKRWWAERKKKSLREIQIEVLEWTVSSETKQAQKFGADIAQLTAILEKLRHSDRPLKPRYPGYDPLGHETNR
jgi:hypothetical protein